MRKVLVSAFLAVLAIAPGAAAFAASVTPPAAAATASTAEQTAEGAIKTYSKDARTLQLDSGTWFYMPLDFKMPDLKVGQHVTLHWKANGSAHDITKIDVS